MARGGLRIEDLISICLQTPGLNGCLGIPVLLWGSPGIGKSSITVQVAERLEWALETVILSVREPTDIAGLPVIRKDEGVVFEPASWAKRLALVDNGILFLDELNTAPPSVQAAALRVVVERIIGDLVLPKGIRVVAATNPLKQSSGGWNLAPPLANRFTHLNFSGPSEAEWVEWILNPEMEKSSIVKQLDMEKWRASYAKAKGLVTSFIMSKKSILGCNGSQIPKDPEKASRAWPSPRTWDMAIRLLATCDMLNVDYCELIAGTVGDGASAEFTAFNIYADLPNPEDLIYDRATFKPDKNRIDRTLVITNSLAAYAIEFPDKSNKVWELIGEYSKTSKDVAVPAIRSLVKAKQFHSKEAMKTLANMKELLSSITQDRGN